MSRIGKKPIQIPSGVEISIEGQQIKVKGSKGELSFKVQKNVEIEKKDDQVMFSIKDINNKRHKAFWGTNRQLVANMITGVSDGYSRQLEVNGVGYKVELKGDKLVLNVGFSHPVEFLLPKGVSAKIEKNVITLESIDKQLLGETAANIRKIRKPEPYKGKGIKYMEEEIRRKAGKQVKTGTA